MSMIRMMHNMMASAGGGGGGSSLFDTVMAFNPWGYWRLDETGTLTTATDSSGNGHHGTYSATGLTNAAGLFSGSQGAKTFNGGSGKINLPAKTMVLNQALTIQVAFTTTAADPRHFLSAHSSVPNQCWQFRANTGKVEYVSFSPGVATLVGSTTINDGNAHFAWAVVDPSLSPPDECKIYVDGARVDPGVTASNFSFAVATAQPAIGARNNSTTQEMFNGKMCELAIFDSALSSVDIAAIWAARNTA